MKLLNIRCHLKSRESLREINDDPSNSFQMLDAVEENDFENIIKIFHEGTGMVVEAEDRSDCEGVHLGRISAG